MQKLSTLTLFLGLICFRLSAQSVPPTATVANPTVSIDENGRTRLELIVPTEGEHNALFLKAKDWVYKTYNSGKTVEQYDDKEAGRIAVKARTSELTWKVGLGIVNTAGAFTYNLTLDVKDGKSRMVIDNITYKKGELKDAMILASGADLGDTFPSNWPTLGKKAMLKHWNEMQADGTRDLVLLATSFQAAMTKKGTGSDW